MSDALGTAGEVGARTLPGLPLEALLSGDTEVLRVLEDLDEAAAQFWLLGAFGMF